jgi:sec-independent protein translocase protein TatA
MGRLGMGELLVILALAVLLFGSKRLPELASGIGQAIKNFKRSVEGRDDIDATPNEKQLAEKSRLNPIDEKTEEAKVVDNKKS